MKYKMVLQFKNVVIKFSHNLRVTVDKVTSFIELNLQVMLVITGANAAPHLVLLQTLWLTRLGIST